MFLNPGQFDLLGAVEADHAVKVRRRDFGFVAKLVDCLARPGIFRTHYGKVTAVLASCETPQPLSGVSRSVYETHNPVFSWLAMR